MAAIKACPEGEPNSANLHTPIGTSGSTKKGLGARISIFSNATKVMPPRPYAAMITKTLL